jgi:CDP-4-dehydro-6-deoxyglucose reductase
MDFQVTLEPGSQTFTADEEQTLLDAAINQGISLPYGCQNGVCGACKCQVEKGQIHAIRSFDAVLTPQEIEQGWILACCSQARSSLTMRSETARNPRVFIPKTMPARVKQIRLLAHDVAELTLQLPSQAGFEYDAGQFVEIILEGGQRRSYSMANAPHEAAKEHTITLHVRHMPGGVFSHSVFHTLKEKDVLRLYGPLGSCVLDEQSQLPLVLVASGTGFAPVRAFLSHLFESKSLRSVQVYWGGRHPSDFYEEDWLAQLASKWPQLTYTLVLSEPLSLEIEATQGTDRTEGQGHEPWTGRVGLVHEVVMADYGKNAQDGQEKNIKEIQVYACGSPAMVQAIHAGFMGLGLDPNHFFSDPFTMASTVSTSSGFFPPPTT